MGVLLIIAVELSKSVPSSYYMQSTGTLESYKPLEENSQCIYFYTKKNLKKKKKLKKCYIYDSTGVQGVGNQH